LTAWCKLIMADFVLLENDIASFLPVFGTAIVVVMPGTLKSSGPATANGRKVCVDGDESRVVVPGCAYIAPPHVIPGTGTLKIAALGGDQKATKTKTGGKAVLLKGSQFEAKFEVQVPAQQPPPGPGPPIPDATPQYAGKGMFITTNMKFRAT
jgi:Contractile injection system spike tip protein